LDDKGNYVDEVDKASKLTAKEGTHSLFCRVQKGVNSVMQHLAWIVLGNF
jgi:hypothetical protein